MTLVAAFTEQDGYEYEITFEQSRSFPYTFNVFTPWGERLDYGGSASAFARKNGIAKATYRSGFAETERGALRKIKRLVKRHKRSGSFSGSQPVIVATGEIE